MLKLGCTLPNLAKICLHKSTDYKFYPFFSSDSDLLEKIREDMTGCPSIVFTRKAVANETFIRNSKSLCKSIVGMLVNSILILCVRICPQVCIRDGTTMKKHKKSRQGKIEFEHLKIWSCHTFKQPELNVKLRVTTLQENRKKLIAVVLMVIATIVRLSLNQWVVISIFVLVKKLDRA